jgi:hypothetical protein
MGMTAGNNQLASINTAVPLKDELRASRFDMDDVGALSSRGWGDDDAPGLDLSGWGDDAELDLDDGEVGAGPRRTTKTKKAARKPRKKTSLVTVENL